MANRKKGILLVNLGTPDDPGTASVRRYLREFLMDARVIDIAPLPRWLLVNLIIAPFRGPKSAKEYQKLWDERGSPLKYHTEDLTQLLQNSLSDDYTVSYAMRYQNPSIEQGLNHLRDKRVESILVVPLFPQYASATTGSVIEKVNDIVKQWQVIPNLQFVSKFFEDELFLSTIIERAKPMMEAKSYDHFVFSYHGLPERQIYKASTGSCELGKCCNKYGSANLYCYRAQCFETSKLLAEKLDIPSQQYTVAFQSRLGKDPWIQPYTEDVIQTLASNGVKNVLVFSPAFVADCLETTLEVGETYQEEFLEQGGDSWDLVPSLNTEATWVKCLAEMVTTRLS